MPDEIIKDLPAKAQLNLPTELRQKLQEEAAGIATRITQPSGNRITIDQSKQFKLPDGQLVRDALDVIIVDFVAAQSWYEKPFDRDNIAPPACFAIGLDPTKLVPSVNSLVPQVEAGKSCAECWAFQWNSDRQGGKGKDCSTNILAATLFPDAKIEDPLMLLKISATATRYFNSYAALLSRAHQMPPCAFVTQLRFDPSQTFASLRFMDPRPLDGETLAMVMSRRDEARKMLLTEPDMTQARAERERGEAEKSKLQRPARPAQRR